MDLSFRFARAVAELRLWLQRLLSSTPTGGGSAVLASLLRLALDVHGHQLFFCPYFNGDPHPGNILLLPDGRVGLIDFGQCRQFSAAERRGLARLLLAVARPPSSEADAEVADAFLATGVRTKNSDARFLAQVPRLMFCSLRAEWFERGHLAEILRRDRIEHLPLHLVMAYRTAMLLRGLCLVLQENASVADAWAPMAQRWLQQEAAAEV